MTKKMNVCVKLDKNRSKSNDGTHAGAHTFLLRLSLGEKPQ